jgi:hypothetical protein
MMQAKSFQGPPNCLFGDRVIDRGGLARLRKEETGKILQSNQLIGWGLLQSVTGLAGGIEDHIDRKNINYIRPGPRAPIFFSRLLAVRSNLDHFKYCSAFSTVADLSPTSGAFSPESTLIA